MPKPYVHAARSEVWTGALGPGSRAIAIAPNDDCQGLVRLLYSRRSNPARWEVVGAYCDACGAVTIVATG